VPSADKRARQKENARAAKAQREAAEKRRKRTRSTIIIGVAGVIIVGLFVIASVAGNGKKKSGSSTSTTTGSTAPSTTVPPKAAAGDVKLDPAKTYKATIGTNFGNIVVTLDAKHAPVGAAHFVTLAKNGVYDGSRWHRIIKGFVIQGGAPGGDPTKNYGKAAIGEVPTGAYKLGDIAAAKTGTDPNGTFDAQFFIVTGAQGEALPPQYADFGTVTSGMEVVRKIEALKTDANGEPSAKATIDKVTISES
jgi:cyclophilin family peptidyl-prolyl cis-trans isomerase